MSTLPRIPEILQQINVVFAEWGLIIGLSGVGSLLPLVFTNQLVSRFGTSIVIRLSALGITLSLFSIPWITNSALMFFVSSSAKFCSQYLIAAGVSTSMRWIISKRELVFVLWRNVIRSLNINARDTSSLLR